MCKSVRFIFEYEENNTKQKITHLGDAWAGIIAGNCV